MSRATYGLICLLFALLLAPGASAQEAMLLITAEDGTTVYLPVADGSSSQVRLGDTELAFSLVGGEVQVAEPARKSFQLGSTAEKAPLATATLATGFPLELQRNGAGLTVEVLGVGQTIVSYEIDLPNGETLRGKSLDNKPFVVKLRGEGVRLELRPDFSQAPAGTVPVELTQKAMAGGLDLARQGHLPASLRLSDSTEHLTVGTTQLGIRASLAKTENIAAHLPQNEPMDDIDNTNCCVCCEGHPTCACGCAAECDGNSCCVGTCC